MSAVVAAYLTTRRRPHHHRQAGQAILLILLVTVVGVLIGLSLIDSGIQTSEKMQLQNAADAVAYSVSTIEARDLNFTAYTNRAMVANEVAMAQLVGLSSWARMTRSVPEFLNVYLSPVIAALSATGVLAGVAAGLQALITGLRFNGNLIQGFIQPFASRGSQAIATLNRGYSLGQRSLHLASFTNSLGSIDDLLKANARDAHFSMFGVLALARHFNTHYSDLALKGDAFVTSYRQNKAWDTLRQRGPTPLADSQKQGMQRLAALVNASRDRFSLDRAGGWSMPLIPHMGFNRCVLRVWIPFVGRRCALGADFGLGLSIDRTGGSDLRAISKGNEQHYNWSAVDAVGGNLDLHLSLSFFGKKVTIVPHTRGGPPMGIGGAQAGEPSGDNTGSWGMPNTYQAFYAAPDHAYGKTPRLNPVPWLWPNPAPPLQGPFFSIGSNNINDRYVGLPRYNDSRLGGAAPVRVDKNLKLGFESPYLLVALVKQDDDIAHSRTRGRFRLDRGDAQDEIAVLGKSEVYFKRPDGRAEEGNGFNPYWQARLVDTSYIDRTAALAIQQRQPWLARDVQVNLSHLEALARRLP